MKHMRLAMLAALLCAGAAHAGTANANTTQTNTANASGPGPYVPGVGEIMGATQMRHIKLWYAGLHQNWALARYELGEIKEGLGDVIAYHPVFKGAPVKALYAHYTGLPFRELEQAIDKRQRHAFAKAYDSLTAACNACHRAADQGQIVIRRPVSNPYSDQDFAARKR